MCEQYDASAIGAYAADEAKHKGEVAVEVNPGEAICIIYLDPEEAILLASDLIREAQQAEVWAA